MVDDEDDDDDDDDDGLAPVLPSGSGGGAAGRGGHRGLSAAPRCRAQAAAALPMNPVERIRQLAAENAAAPRGCRWPSSPCQSRSRRRRAPTPSSKKGAEAKPPPAEEWNSDAADDGDDGPAAAADDDDDDEFDDEADAGAAADAKPKLFARARRGGDGRAREAGASREYLVSLGGDGRARLARRGEGAEAGATAGTRMSVHLQGGAALPIAQVAKT